MLARICLSALALSSSFVIPAFSAPLVFKRSTSISKRAFVLRDYADFQISGGVGGDAAAEANEVFLAPFDGVDLATVTANELAAVKTMREAAEAAETELFNVQIEAAGGTKTPAGTALQVGKIKNKVLKLTGEIQAIQIKIAQSKAAGKDTAADEAKVVAEQKKLTNNINLDKAAAGQPSTAVAGSDAGTPGAATTGGAVTDGTVAATGTSTACTRSLAKRVFTELAYADFQISGGNAGNAEAEANAVFVKPFDGLDLATVTADELKAVQTMREAAEAAEVDLFNPKIDAAGGTKTPEGQALQNGKIKNKVLKLTGECQAISIKIAQSKAAGKDTAADEAKLVVEQKKLANNIALDVKAAGQTSTPVAGSADAPVVAATTDECK